MIDQILSTKFQFLKSHLDEKSFRLCLAAEAKSIGWGGISYIALITGVSRDTISDGIYELEHPETIEKNKIRKSGGGRKKVVDTDPTLLSDLEALIEPLARGDPESPLRWTCKSTRALAKELNNNGHSVSHVLVADILQDLGYSLQSNKKSNEGIASHPDRNEQFEFINEKARQFIASGQPVISVDAKKKELVGPFKNNGREWRPKGDPRKVNVHDFEIPDYGKINPYGIFDQKHNEGWINLGVDHDTATFAVESIRRWWVLMGNKRYSNAKQLLITADGGGSNGHRVKLWKFELQKLADETDLDISVSHYPPGTSKWNKIEHRLFSYISQNWRGQPLISHEVIINLIANTRTKTGLIVKCDIDLNQYPTGIKITKEMMDKLALERENFHGDWNYTLRTRKSQ